MSIPFNPIRLACLVAWVYICLYFVQRIQFSPLVPRRYKSAAYIVTLFAGPILLLLLLIVDSARKSSRTGDGIFETVKQQIERAAADVRSARRQRSKKGSIIRLLNSSGRSINEIYITFAKTLRSVLRQDPDVICVGEIRDEETARIALRASQTGHLVLATIHCDSNRAALVRLTDLGVSPLLLSSGLSLLVSQRLLRLLCEYCKTPAQLTKALIREVSHAVGTSPCLTNITRAGPARARLTGLTRRTAAAHRKS